MMIRRPAAQRNPSNRQSTLLPACARAAGIALVAALAAFGETAHAASGDGALADYTALEHALSDGRTVSVRIDMNHCTAAEGGKPGPAFRGGLRIDSWLIPDGRYIAFIDVHRTLDPKNRPVTEYVRYHVMPDNTATIDTAFAPDGADTATPRGSYRCAINQGIRFVATESR
jgi:hypothetical protein